jgi:hypothetical protein
MKRTTEKMKAEQQMRKTMETKYEMREVSCMNSNRASIVTPYVLAVATMKSSRFAKNYL